jgi:predicted transposase YbfD/YdcC
VYGALAGISKEKWTGVRAIIQVHRKTIHHGCVAEETAYFISSLPKTTSAKVFNAGVRSHWGIESFHYIKDVTFGEDGWKVKKKNAPANYSLARNLVINVFRNNNLHHIQETIERCANNVPFMLSLF